MTPKDKRNAQARRGLDWRRGSILALTPVMIVVLLSVGLFVVDLGYLYATKSSLQNAADSASFTGALRLRVALGEVEEPTAGEKKMKKKDKKAKKKSEEPQEFDASFIPHLQALAIEFAERNHQAATGILDQTEINIGFWNFSTRSFEAVPPDQANAVRVTVRRGGDQSQKLTLLLARLFGMMSTDLEANSITAFNTLVDGSGDEHLTMPYLVK
ncbi:MAG: hypothetical protein KF752_14230 [Pirellulaceae bacterium]|nr:hypothetical protein [Pirellulaceae bacterium]